jgi:predicted phage terminase large subunit-like protein
LEIADIEKRVPDRDHRGASSAYHGKERFRSFGVESIQFQEFFATSLAAEAHRRNLTLNVVELKPNVDKLLRIQTLQPWIKNGWIVFRKNMRAMIDQLVHYPMGDHDDGPDVLEQLKTMIEAAVAKGVYKDAWSNELLFEELPHGLTSAEGYAERYIGVSYGTAVPTVFLDILDDGKTLWLVREYYWDSLAEGAQKTDRDYANDLEDLVVMGADRDPTIILPEDAASFKTELRARGLYARDADDDLLRGIRLVSTMFSRRLIRMSTACTHTIEEHRSYAWDIEKARLGVEEPMKGSSPTCDALRRAVKTKISPWRLAA